MKVLGWKAWYRWPGSEIREYSSRDTLWEALPEIGVQVIVVYYAKEYAPGKVRRDVMRGRDFYWHDGRNAQGAYMQSDTFPEAGIVRCGIEVSDEEYRECYGLAWDDRVF